jgi:ubiquitin-protein ligase
MLTPQEKRKIRIKNDYEQMVNIKSDVVDWKPIRGNPPYVEAYELTIKVKTIISSNPSYRTEHILSLEIPAGYPTDAPLIVMKTTPPPYHPNWYTSGKWCFGKWYKAESLGRYVIRMIQTLQFDMEITNPDSPANREAKDWFLEKKTSGLFPCDRTILPDPTTSKSEVKAVKKKMFIVQK